MRYLQYTQNYMNKGEGEGWRPERGGGGRATGVGERQPGNMGKQRTKEKEGQWVSEDLIKNCCNIFLRENF